MDEYDHAVEDLVCASQEVAEELPEEEMSVDGSLEDLEQVDGNQNESSAMDEGSLLAQEDGTRNDKLPLSYFQSRIDGLCNQLYFMNQHNEPEHGGIRNIVFRANRQKKHSNRLASVSGTKTLFSLTDLLVGDTRSKQEMLLQHQRLLMNHFSSPLESDVEIPMDRRGADRLCLRSCFSVFQNIPSDEVFNIPGHACISLKSVLDKKFAEGVEFSFIKNTERWTMKDSTELPGLQNC